MLPSAVLALLPTPTVSDANGPGLHGTGAPDLRTTISLLPTPKATDGKRNDSASEQARTSPALGAVVPQNSSVDWGVYAWAIARWEQTFAAEAPAPTVLSQRGKPVLNPVFVEWLMGVAAGWVTDVPGLSRPQLLRILGNGVVPAQGAEAFRYLLTHLSAAAA